MEGKIYERDVLENRRAPFNLFSMAFRLEQPKDWVLGVDLSHWQGICNFPLMNSKGIKFGITKATDIGWGTKKGFVDSKAVHNYTEMGKVGWLRGGYHWLDPKYGTAEYQADYYLDNFYFQHPTEFPPVLDLEDSDVISWNDMLMKAKGWLERVEKRTGRIPIVYTSNGYISKFLKSQTGFLARYPLWIAHYIQRSYPTVPEPWARAVMWQYSDRGHFPYYKWGGASVGKEWGSGSSYLDMNWWMGTYIELLEFCDGVVVEPPTEPNEVLFKAKCIIHSLYTRKGPGTNYPMVGYLMNGQIVDVYEEKNGWFRIDADVWCSGSRWYMQRVTTSEEKPLYKIEVVASALNVRSGAGISFPALYAVKSGQRFDVYEEKNNWVRIGDGEWCSGYPAYVKKL